MEAKMGDSKPEGKNDKVTMGSGAEKSSGPKGAGAIALGATNYEMPYIGTKTIGGKREGTRIKLYGPDNRYPYTLIDLFKSSPTHGAIVRLKIKKTAGSEWKVTPLPQHPERAKYLFQDTNIRKFSKLLVSDYELFGGFAIRVKWSRHQDGFIYVSTWERVPFQDVRIAVDKEGKLDSYMIATDWKNQAKGKVLMPFNGKPPQLGEDQTAIEELYYYTIDGTEQDSYPTPDYESGLTSAHTEAGIVDYYDAEVYNGLQPQTVIEVTGPIPDAEKQQETRKEFQAMSGPRGKRKLLYWSDGQEDGQTKVKIHQAQNDNRDTRWLQTNGPVVQKILTAHQLPTPVLAGIPGSGSLGGNGTELEMAEAIFQSTVIADHQADIESALTWLLDKGQTAQSLDIVPRTLITSTTTTNQAGQ